MKIKLFFTLCGVIFLSDRVLANADNDSKKALYPYVAFLYYSDESITESTGARFLRGAVLVKPDWLITSSVGPAIVNDQPHGFPRKTLLARLGAVAIDDKFTLNEDEDEQETEVIQIVRPHNHSATQWWRTDITLLKTLMPFNLTKAVNIAQLRIKPALNYTNCFILVFSKKTTNWTEDRTLMQLFVDIQSASSRSCGTHFHEETMLCANDNEENKNIGYDPEFCEGNSGGPLVCNEEVTGIQTYVEKNCKQPHLYQHLAAWENFITCGIEDKCQENHCSHMCIVTNKDDPNPTKEDSGTDEPRDQPDVSDIPMSISEDTTTSSSTAHIEVIRYEDELFSTASTSSTTEATTERKSTVTHTTTKNVTTTTEKLEQSTAWPKEKDEGSGLGATASEDPKIERKVNVEAQRHRGDKKARSAADRNNIMCFFQSLFSIFILASLV